MKLAKIRVADIGKAYLKGQKIKGNALDNEKKEEVLQQNKANTLEFGNYLTKNDPDSVVPATDENSDGTIDEEETENALLSTGRKYAAKNTIKTDNLKTERSEQVIANAAAVEGRKIQRMDMTVKTWEDKQKRQEESDAQDAQQIKNYEAIADSMGLAGEEKSMFVNTMTHDKKMQRAAVADMTYEEKIEATTEIDTVQQSIWRPTDSYSKAYGKGTPKEIQAANEIGLKEMNETIDNLDYTIDVLKQAKADPKRIKKLVTLKGKMLATTNADGTFGYEKMNKLLAEYGGYRQEVKKSLDDSEDEGKIAVGVKEFPHLQKYLVSKNTNSSKVPAKLQEDAAYGTAVDTAEKDQTSTQKQTIRRVEGTKPTSVEAAVKNATKDYPDDPNLITDEERNERGRVKLKITSMMKKDKSLKKLQPFEIKNKAREALGLKVEGKNALSGGKSMKNGKKSLGKSTKKDGTTATTKDGRAVVSEDGQWVLQ